MTSRLNPLHEMIVAVALLLTGLIALPLAIYFVGAQVIGEYVPNGDATDLIAAIWFDLAQGNGAAWLLVLSPFLVVQLLRLARWHWRRRAAARP